MASYKIISDNQSYDINTLSSGSVTLPYYGGYKDTTNNVTGNISKSTPHDISIHYISGIGWLTSSISMKDDTASSITLNYTSASSERSARIYLKGAGLTTSNYITINQKKRTTVSFYWKCTDGYPYNNKTLWCNKNIINNISDSTFDLAMVTASLSQYYIPSYDSNLHNTIFRFEFTISDTDNKYHVSFIEIPILYEIKYNGSIFTNILSIINHEALSLDNFFTTLNREYVQLYV